MLILIDNYDSFTYNVAHYLGELGADVLTIRNDELTVSEILAKSPQAIVISPGPGTPDTAGVSMDLIKTAAESGIPVFGICLGLQASVQAYGGKIIGAGEIMHGKMGTITHQGKSVFAGLPNPLTATRYHSLVADPQTLPADFEVTATQGDIIMGVAHKTLPIHAVQFHPESIASQCGHEMLDNFLKIAAIK